MSEVNELSPLVLGINALNPWPGADSSSRAAMMASHIGQMLVIAEPTERRCQTGIERRYGEYTFSVRAPEDATVVAIIDGYRDELRRNVTTGVTSSLAIYITPSFRLGCIRMPRMCLNHTHLGFQYKPTASYTGLRQGSRLRRDEILLDSPSVTDNGDYTPGIELETAFISLPGVSEDGFGIADDVLPRLAFRTYEHRAIEWGTSTFPLAVHGRGESGALKIFPDLGDLVREDGLLMALREFDPVSCVVDQSVNALTEVRSGDKATYCSGANPNNQYGVKTNPGRVVEIKVYYNGKRASIADSMASVDANGILDQQVVDYYRNTASYHRQIIQAYEGQRALAGNKLEVTPELQRMITDSYAYFEASKKQFRKTEMDVWRVEITVEYLNTPSIGYKLTDFHGGKGVICKIIPRAHMPRDAAGNSADIVSDPNASLNRMNIGRLHEQYINAASRELTSHLRSIFGPKATENSLRAFRKASPENEAAFCQAWGRLMRYYEITTPRQHAWMTNGTYKASQEHHMAYVLADGVRLYMPTDNEPEYMDIVSKINAEFPPVRSAVTYTGESGIPVTTSRPVLIGSLYMMLLEKIGDGASAVASAKLQNFGIISTLSNRDRYSAPTRLQAVRAHGEAEVRIGVSYTSPQAAAEIMDRNGNLDTHRTVCDNILTAVKPTRIATVTGRDWLGGDGNARPLQIAKHMMYCSGIEFDYMPR